ncbi:MAG: hypothetical protein JWO36_5860 [Myxococcales bacterium]|nr:hypothetical protein [Myxococcales bacterium]
MTVYLHDLDGCAASPHAHYLKAIGLLRLVAEQDDPEARGYWRDERFVLATVLDRDALRAFLLDAYHPTAMVAPWNGGSGFYPKDNTDAIEPFSVTTAPRFSALRAALHSGRELVGDRDKSPKDEDKAEMIRTCRNTWRGAQLEWLNAAVVLAGDDVKYPALLGTGGNDGRLDFTNNFMQRLTDLFDAATGSPHPDAAMLLDSSLFGTATDGLRERAIGQFLPGAAGGANSTRGFSGSSLINPWDFVLMLEGAIVFAVAAVRRLEGTGVSQAAAPFAVRAQAAGYASAAASDESVRGEQWFPLWRMPSRLAEVKSLMREGRMRTGASGARNAIDAVRSFARLGTARGVDAFVRFGYMERNGQSNLAVPLGTWSVGLKPDVRLIDQIEPWVERFRRAAGSDHAPAALARMSRRLEDAVLAVCGEPRMKTYWQVLLGRLGEAEDELVRRPKFTTEDGIQPLPELKPEWAAIADDGSAEFRIALAIATQRLAQPKSSKKTGTGIRGHCVPLDREASWPRFATNAHGLTLGPDQSWKGRDLVDDLAAIVIRRVTRARTWSVAGLGLDPTVTAPLAMVAQFIDGQVDDARIARLARGLMSVNTTDDLPPRSDPSFEHADAAHGVFRLLWLPERYELGVPSDDPTALRLLMAGRIDAASQLAIKRLVTRGVRSKLRTVIGDARLARRLVAALAIPISRNDAKYLQQTVCVPTRARETDPHTTLSRTGGHT